ncbi:hypothetical protein ACP4OV_019985 [Aristida adscensionis]
MRSRQLLLSSPSPPNTSSPGTPLNALWESSSPPYRLRHLSSDPTSTLSSSSRPPAPSPPQDISIIIMADAEVFKRASKSLVIVSDGHGDYCSGFVAKTSARSGTLIVTQSAFVDGQDNLIVHFCDDVELPASVISKEECFCLLRTDYHSSSNAIELMEDEITISRTLTFPPSSPQKLYQLPSFVVLESAAAYDQDPNDRIKDSEKLFLVACHYNESTENRQTKTPINRMVAAPVFHMMGRAIGIILENCYEERNYDTKVGLSAKHVKELIQSLIGEPNGSGDEGCSGDQGSSKRRKQGS